MAEMTETPVEESSRSFWHDVREVFDAWLTPLETPVFETIREWLGPINAWVGGLPPWAWHATAVGLFVVSGMATLLIPRRFIYASAPSPRLWRDLRLWTIIALLPYIAAYHYLQ